VDKKGGRGSLFDKMRARLSGGRFRSLNEQLYTCKGEEALQLMQVGHCHCDGECHASVHVRSMH